jgi:hypothetical protein
MQGCRVWAACCRVAAGHVIQLGHIQTTNPCVLSATAAQWTISRRRDEFDIDFDGKFGASRTKSGSQVYDIVKAKTSQFRQCLSR